jgi:flp pilus assembly protein cpaB
MRLIAVVAGVLLVAILGYAVISGSLFSGGGAPAKQTIVVAKQAIPAYTSITSEMVTTTEVTSGTYLAGTADKPEAVVGTIAQSPIGAGQIVYTNQISRIDLIAGGNPLFMTLKDGQRAMSLSVNDVTGVSNLLRVGNRVDIIAVYNGKEASGTSVHGLATTVLQNVPILAIGKQYESTPGTPAPTASQSDGSGKSGGSGDQGSSSSSSSSSEQQNSEYSTVTFQLSSLQDGEKLALAMNLENVQIYLALRSQNDNEIVQLPTINATEVFS